LAQSSRFIERALGAEFNFKGEFFVDDQDDTADENREVKVGFIQKKFVFEDKKDYRRSVTSLDWSPAYPELFLASYSKMRDWSADEPDGYINIYSLAMHTRPEITLNCQYEVTKAIFNPHDSNIVIGATTSGYILVWDVRAKKDPIRSIDRRDRSKPI
jgi:dynein intermediate chain